MLAEFEFYKECANYIACEGRIEGCMINWAQIKQLEEDVGSEDLSEVVTLFLSEVDEAVSELDAVSGGTPQDIAAALHFLKGSAFNLGFQEFGDYCAEGESQAHGGEISQISFEKVQQLYDSSKTIFLSEISQHCAVEI